MRPKGVVVVPSGVIHGPLWQEAQRILKAKADRAAADKARRDAAPVPNFKCYPMVFVVGKNIDAQGNWLGGLLPKCRVCGAVLQPKETHSCPGFTPKFMEHDQTWKEKQESRRGAIRETRSMLKAITCSVCSEILEDEDDGAWHAEDHGGKPLREGYSLSGDEDDPSGYEDYDEGDYCEGDDDGYDCE